MHNFNATRMLYYNNKLISVEKKSWGYLYLKKSKISKHFILLPDNYGVEEYTSPFR